MAQTVIGFFDDASEAQNAIQKLQSRGISQDRIDMSRGSSGADRGGTSNAATSDLNPVSGSTRDDNSVSRTSDGRTVDQEGRNTNAITDFFNSLFGGHKDEADRFSKVASASNIIITVHALSDEEAEAAADIMDDSGAVDVDERASQYGFTSTRSSLDTGNSDSASRQRMRSRIVNQPVDDRMRLRDRDRDSGFNDSTDSRSIGL